MSDPIMNPIDDASIKDKVERFLNDLKTLDGIAYCFQKDLENNDPTQKSIIQTFFVDTKNEFFEKYDKKGLPLIDGMDLGDVKHYSYRELMSMANDFHHSNRIGYVPFGKLFRGKDGSRDVIVKRWNLSFPPRTCMSKYPAAFQHELRLLMNSDINSNPNVPKLIGFHCERTLAFVYEEKGISMKCLEEILGSDKFSWNDRMNVAVKVGSVLKTFHVTNHVVGGVPPPNIFIDEAYNPMVFNFFERGDNDSQLYSGSDVCSFGVLLLALIKKGGIADCMSGEYTLKDRFDVCNAFDIDDDTLREIKNLSVNCFNQGCSIKTTTITTFLEDLTDLLRSSVPNKQRKTSK